MLELFAHCTVTVVHFTDQNQVSKTMYIVSGVWWSVKLVLKSGMQKSHFCLRPWSLLTILNFSEWQADRHNNILMSLLLLVVETITSTIKPKCKVRLRFNVLFKHTGWPTKMSLFFFGSNFYKNKETFKIFSPQLLEVYGIILVETTLESIMLYYTFSVINTLTLTLSTALLSISCGTRLVSLLMMFSYVCGLFWKTLFQVPLRK